MSIWLVLTGCGMYESPTVPGDPRPARREGTGKSTDQLLRNQAIMNGTGYGCGSTRNVQLVNVQLVIDVGKMGIYCVDSNMQRSGYIPISKSFRQFL